MKTKKAMNQDKVLEVLKGLKIDYQLHTHKAVATVAAAEEIWHTMEGMHFKNLFLRNNKGKQHYLLVAQKDRKINLKELGQSLGGEKLSFASERRLVKYLGLLPGSVSPFGIINDDDRHVKVLLDSTMKKAKLVNFHPNVNTATLALSFADFEVFMQAIGNEHQFVDI